MKIKDKTKILVISPNREQYPCPVAPIGSLNIAVILGENYQEVEFLDLCFVGDSSSAIKDRLSIFKPDYIVFSIRNIDNEVFLKQKFYLNDIKKDVKICRLYSQAKIILGGIGFSIFPRKLMHLLQADFGLVGEGKTEIINLINLLQDKKVDMYSLLKINGLYYWKDKELVINNFNLNYQWSFIENWRKILQLCPIEYFSFNKDEPFPPIFGVKTKNGCIFNCIYCAVPCLESNNLQLATKEKIVDALEVMNKEFNINRIFFTDNVFNMPYDHALNIAREIIKRKLCIKWTCYLHPRYIDTELIKTMQAAGCYGVQFGIDSASQQLVDKWRKGFYLKELQKAIETCNEQGLFSGVSLLIGCLGETDTTLLETLQFMQMVKPKFVWGAFGVRVYRETELASLVYGDQLNDDNFSFLQPRFYISPEIKENGFEIIRKFVKENSKMMIKLNNGIIFKNDGDQHA